MGYEITAAGTKPPTERVDAILKHPRPTTVQDLHRFLGMVNFYRQFVPQAAHCLGPLTSLLAGPKRSKQEIEWGPKEKEAFDRIRHLLTEATLLVHPNANAPLSIALDASDVAVGAVLQQFEDQMKTQKFNEAQQKYSTYDRELTAAYLAIKKFKHFVEGRSFHVYTDHKPLIFAFKQKPERASPRQFRHLDFIGQFTTDIRYLLVNTT